MDNTRLTVPVSIRLMTSADVSGCAQWVATTPLWQLYRVTEDSISERLNAGLAQRETIYVAERSGNVLGFLWLVERGAFHRSNYVQLIGVRPGDRSRGIGRALMEFAEEMSRAQGQDLFLLVSDFNTSAQRFYQHLGYREVGQLEDYVIAGVSELIYMKPCSKQMEKQ